MARVSWLMRRTVGELLGDVDEEGLRRLPRAERAVVHLREQERRDGAPHLRAEPLGVVLVPCELEPLLEAPLDPVVSGLMRCG